VGATVHKGRQETRQGQQGGRADGVDHGRRSTGGQPSCGQVCQTGANGGAREDRPRDEVDAVVAARGGGPMDDIQQSGRGADEQRQ